MIEVQEKNLKMWRNQVEEFDLERENGFMKDYISRNKDFVSG